MPFCKYSSSLFGASNIFIDAKFLNDYLPYAPENCVKVYLFGLMKCQNSASYDNSIENFENVLGLSKQDIIDSFLYWQDQGLVQVLELDPMEIRYLPVNDNLKSLKKVDSKKYASFVTEIQELISSRQINPTEFSKYIDFVENFDMQPADFVMIVKYCVTRKGTDINSNYILTVARVWAEEGVKTADKIEQKIENMMLTSSEVSQVAKALKFRGNLSIEHQQMYDKWTKSFGFSLQNILLLAKKVSTQTKNFSFEMLDKKLTKFFELKLLSFAEIQQYEDNKVALSSLAREINKALGVYYESVENEVDTYIVPWTNRGFEQNSLIQIANFCFKSSIRTLEGMDNIIQKFAKLGLMSVSSIDSYLGEVSETDEKIKKLLQKMGIDRRVNSFDRSFYRTWTYSFKFPMEVVEYCAELAKGKSNAMQYANAILTSWHEQNLTTLEQVKKASNATVKKEEQSFVGKSFGQKSWTDEQVNALFDNLDEINL